MSATEYRTYNMFIPDPTLCAVPLNISYRLFLNPAFLKCPVQKRVRPLDRQ